MRQTKSREPFFLVEGVKLVREAFSAGRVPERVFYAKSFMKHAGRDAVFKLCRAKNVPLDEISERAFLSLSTLEHSEGVMAVIRKKKHETGEIKHAKESGIVVLHEIQDPGNAGTILRLSEASGMDAVFLGNSCASLYNPKTLRASMGAFFHVPCLYGDTRGFMEWLRGENYMIVLADVKGKQPVYETNLTGKCALVFGNESRGLPGEFFEGNYKTACIPMQGKLNSINVAWACAVFLYERMRQQKQLRV